MIETIRSNLSYPKRDVNSKKPIIYVLCTRFQYIMDIIFYVINKKGKRENMEKNYVPFEQSGGRKKREVLWRRRLK